MLERFTDVAKKVLALANQEAQNSNDEFIGSQHILFGLLKEGRGVGSTILKNLGIDVKKGYREVEKLIRKSSGKSAKGKLPHTSRDRKIIEFAIEEANSLNHKNVGTEHLLLGILHDNEGTAAQILINLGIRIEDVRQEVLKIMGSDKPSNTSFQTIEPLTILIDPGKASSEDIGELFFRLSKLYKIMGGSGLEFRALDVREGVPTNV